jgi:FkbM family methyltransferase
VVRDAAIRLGLDVGGVDPSRSALARRLAILSRERIDIVLDIGAHVGQYPRALRAGGYAGRIVSFEPLGSAYAELERATEDDPEWESRELALGNDAGRATIIVSGNSVSSSLLPMTAKHVESAPGSDEIGRENVAVARLDEVADGFILPDDRVALKLDTQGYELEVLQGGERTLSHVHVIEIELSLVELYEGQPLFVEVWRFLSDRGFQCVGLAPVFTDAVSWHVLQLDGLFVRG